ncbi:hypothetical protein FPRO05_12194 [Fusarium proliferatum]|uniref:Zn(2)-C6 fungal-type domain-containing protein n=1 Tax=Gibberella intermedia TaxID=948311 RepID=A0A365N469_GIBIN|nr:hypothetical protein FPRO05_12194 [Fusarium proliferatum]
MHSPSGTRPKKRLACDRCHARKLRCSGDLDGCTRCLGDDLVCVYSPALKVGRPSKASMAGREIQQTQSISDAAIYGISDRDAVTVDSGISMPPSPPQLGDSCITGKPLSFANRVCIAVDLVSDHTALFNSFDFTNTFDNFNATHPFLDMPMDEDLWPLATSTPVSSKDPNIDPRLCLTNETPNGSSQLDRLSRLQQELLRTKLPPVHARGVVTQPRPAKYTEAAMRPVQETLGVVTELLHQCVKSNGDATDPVCSNWQTVLHLVLTPLSLLLSTYDQILQEIRNAVSSSVSNQDCPLFDSLDCRVAGLKLDPPLRLILLATVVDYQLKHLYHTVRTFQSKYMHSGNLGIANCMSSSTMAEVQSTIRSLLAVTRSTLQQSQET